MFKYKEDLRNDILLPLQHRQKKFFEAGLFPQYNNLQFDRPFYTCIFHISLLLIIKMISKYEIYITYLNFIFLPKEQAASNCDFRSSSWS